jgi:hypothetical protein
MKNAALVILVFISLNAKAQSYDFTLTNPNPCGVGCLSINASGQFSVSGGSINSWTGSINGQPLNLISGLFPATTPWTLSSPFFPYPMNLVPWTCTNCFALDKAPPTPGSTLVWYAPVLLTVTPVPKLSTGKPTPPPIRVSVPVLSSSPAKMENSKLAYEVGLPLAAAVVTWLINREWHRHREALPAGRFTW